MVNPAAHPPRRPVPAPDRLSSLDTLRGLTVAAMILVTDPGSYAHVYPPLLHAAWQGITPTDIIFPAFLVTTGLALTLSFAARLGRGAIRKTLLLHVLRRSALIFLIGLVLNAVPDLNLHTLRIPGVLQRIALCYLAAALLYLVLPAHPRRRAAILMLTVATLLAAYWLAITRIPVPGFGPGHLDTLRSLPAWLDRRIFTPAHLWPWGITPGLGVTFDPEGILSTLPALATLLLGTLAGELLRTTLPARRKALLLFVLGIALIVLGLALAPVMPLIKKLWTPSFALLSGGIALASFAALYTLIDLLQVRRWTPPALVFGTNAMLAFAVSGLLTTALNLLRIGPQNVHAWANAQIFAAWLPPRPASLAYALTIVLLNLLLLLPLYRKRIFFRV